MHPNEIVFIEKTSDGHWTTTWQWSNINYSLLTPAQRYAFGEQTERQLKMVGAPSFKTMGLLSQALVGG